MPGSETKKARDRERMQEKRRLAEEAINASGWLIEIIEGAKGSIKHGEWRDDKGRRLKDTLEWVQFYVALKRLK